MQYFGQTLDNRTSFIENFKGDQFNSLAPFQFFPKVERIFLRDFSQEFTTVSQRRINVVLSEFLEHSLFQSCQIGDKSHKDFSVFF